MKRILRGIGHFFEVVIRFVFEVLASPFTWL